MNPGLQIGDISEISVVVDATAQASLLGLPIHPLYGTAGMIAHMEWAARQHILPYLEDGEEGVGYQVQVTHLAPAPLGADVLIRSVVTDIQPRRIASQVEAWLGSTKIGEGTMVQALVLREKLYACVAPVKSAETEWATLGDSKENGFAFRVLRWENDMPGCTRYDEWLVCQVQWGTTRHEGAFLLRYEIEEWYQACLAVLLGEKSEYQSDFLEPVLSVQMQAESNRQASIHVKLLRPNAQPETLQLQVTSANLRQFTTSLGQQLTGFPSLL